MIVSFDRACFKVHRKGPFILWMGWDEVSGKVPILLTIITVISRDVCNFNI